MVMEEQLRDLRVGDKVRILGKWLILEKVEHDHNGLTIWFKDFTEGAAYEYADTGKYYTESSYPMDIQEILHKRRTGQDLKDAGELKRGMCFRDNRGVYLYYLCEHPKNKFLGLFYQGAKQAVMRELRLLTYVPNKKAEWAED